MDETHFFGNAEALKDDDANMDCAGCTSGRLARAGDGGSDGVRNGGGMGMLGEGPSVLFA